MINYSLLRKIADRIRRFPEQYDQNVWMRTEDNYGTEVGTVPVDLKEIEVDTCGTACCIAGWAVVLHPDPDTVQLVADKHNRDYGTTARELLGTEYLSLFDHAVDVLYIKQSTKEVDWDAFLDAAQYDVNYLETYDNSYSPQDYMEDYDEYPEDNPDNLIRANPVTVAALLDRAANLAEFVSDEQANLLLKLDNARTWMRNYERDVMGGIKYNSPEYEPTGAW